jgi:hypothetical protein
MHRLSSPYSSIRPWIIVQLHHLQNGLRRSAAQAMPNSSKNQLHQLFLAAAEDNKIGNVGHRPLFSIRLPYDE